MKGKKIFAAVTAMSLLLQTCTYPVYAKQTLKVTNVTNYKKTMYVGATFQLKANTAIKNLTFSSSKVKVVKVTKKGILTALDKGSAVIKITNKTTKEKKSIKVTVKKPTMSQVSQTAGSYIGSVKVKITAVKGYDIYYTTSGTFASSKKIQSKKSKTINITKTSTLKLYPVKAGRNLSTKYLNQTASKYACLESYSYVISKAEEVSETKAPQATEEAKQTQIPDVVETEAPTQAPDEELSTQTPNVTQTEVPTQSPVADPTETPTTEQPTQEPDEQVTPQPTQEATEVPSMVPTQTPTSEPTQNPTATPTITPTVVPTVTPTATPSPTPNNIQTTIDGYIEPFRAEYDETDELTDFREEDSTIIQLSDSEVTIEGSGAKVKKGTSTLTISSAGTYIVSGEWSEGNILIDASKTDLVHLILNGTSITCSNYSPISVTKADRVILTLANGTTNTLTDGTSYDLKEGEDEPDAALFSKKDLTINGEGTLTIQGNYKNGIKCKDDLKIMSGTIFVNAVNNGIVGRDSLCICGGDITVSSGADGFKTTNDATLGKGYLDITGGTISIDSKEDGIQAETTAYIDQADIKITTTQVSGTTSDSFKGIKVSSSGAIYGGTFDINTADDGLHSNGDMLICGGVFNISSGDDGIHTDKTLMINNGTIDIKKSYEGLEAAYMVINNGSISIVSSDDGINVAGGKDSSSSSENRPNGNQFGGNGGFQRPGGGGMEGENSSADYQLHINGGYIVVDASGDGLDANGCIYMTGGTVLVNGPTSNNDGALDYDISFEITGGVLIAAGSSGMAEAPSSTSSQYCLNITFSSTKQANSLVHVQDASGKDIATFAPSKAYASVIVSTPELKKGSSYSVYSGGSASGTKQNGYYTELESYSGGSLFSTATISSIITSVGNGGRPGGF